MGKTHLNEINLIECVIATGFLDVKDRDDVFVVEIAQQLHFSQGSETKHRVVERCDLLDGNFLPRRFVHCGTVA